MGEERGYITDFYISCGRLCKPGRWIGGLSGSGEDTSQTYMYPAEGFVNQVDDLSGRGERIYHPLTCILWEAL